MKGLGLNDESLYFIMAVECLTEADVMLVVPDSEIVMNRSLFIDQGERST